MVDFHWWPEFDIIQYDSTVEYHILLGALVKLLNMLCISVYTSIYRHGKDWEAWEVLVIILQEVSRDYIVCSIHLRLYPLTKQHKGSTHCFRQLALLKWGCPFMGNSSSEMRKFHHGFGELAVLVSFFAYGSWLITKGFPNLAFQYAASEPTWISKCFLISWIWRWLRVCVYHVISRLVHPNQR